MKIYQCTHIDPHEGTCYTWGKNKTQARARMAELMKNIGVEPVPAAKTIDVAEHDLSHGADGFVRFLNRRFTRDNG